MAGGEAGYVAGKSICSCIVTGCQSVWLRLEKKGARQHTHRQIVQTHVRNKDRTAKAESRRENSRKQKKTEEGRGKQKKAQAKAEDITNCSPHKKFPK